MWILRWSKKLCHLRKYLLQFSSLQLRILILRDVTGFLNLYTIKFLVDGTSSSILSKLMSNYSPSICSISTLSGNYFLSLMLAIDSLVMKNCLLSFLAMSDGYSGSALPPLGDPSCVAITDLL